MAYKFKEILTGVREVWPSRKMDLMKKWDFYYGDSQRFYLPRYAGETTEEYNDRVRNATVENHCQKTCDVLVGYLYGQPKAESRVAVRAEKDEKLLGRHNEILEDCREYNNFDALRIDIALMVSVTGFALVYHEFVDKRTGLPFPSNTSKDEKKEYGVVRYELFDSVDSMPLPYVSPQAYVYPRILGGVARYYSLELGASSYFDRILNKRVYTDDYFELFDETGMKRARVETGEEQPISTEPNEYGNINYWFTLFRNYGDPMYLEGRSDIDQIIPLQNELNELANDDRTTIAYHSFPILKMLKGAKMPPNFIRKANSVLEFDGDQDADYLTWDNVLEASQKRQESIRRQMTVTSGVSQLSRGNAEDVGQVRSGPGLKTLFQADINAVGVKIPYFVQAEKHVAEYTLKMWEFQTGESMGEFEICVEFPEDFVGIDELLKAQTEQIEVQEGMESLREIIKEKHPEIGSEEEIDAILEEIQKQRESVKKMEQLTRPAQTPGGQSVAQSKK